MLKEETVHRLIESDGQETPERANHEFAEDNAEEERDGFPMQADTAVFQDDPFQQPTDKDGAYHRVDRPTS